MEGVYAAGPDHEGKERSKQINFFTKNTRNQHSMIQFINLYTLILRVKGHLTHCLSWETHKS